MRLLLLLIALPAILGQSGFGRSYLKNSRLCHEWSCLNTKLGLPDSLPPRDQLSAVLRTLLPGHWQDVVDGVLAVCYGDRPRRYTNTCPGQAVFHCVVDQLINQCPEEYQRKDDACSPVATLAGLKLMFSQSRYEDMQNNAPKERRPPWFLKNYFSSKCCNLPPLFDSASLSQCGFQEVIRFMVHTPKTDHFFEPFPAQAVEGSRGSKLHIVDLNTDVKTSTAPSATIGDHKTANYNDTDVSPLECCDMSEFIAPSWPSECNFTVSWDPQRRLVVDQDYVVTTPHTIVKKSRDRMVVPLSCEKETCIFQQMNIVTYNGSVDIAAFTKLLDNFTDAHELWNKAKARVFTTCLKRPLVEYEAECEINKILACTLDVLTENCPYTTKSDICKHSKEDIVCQISSSKYRAKNRRSTCYLPDIVHPHYLKQCGASSLSRVQHGIEVSRLTSPPKWPIMKSACKETTPSTTCLMKKMSVLNKYGFMDYFLMKDRIRMTSERAWQGLSDVIISAFVNAPLYQEHCNSAKKLLNVLDTMILTCPASRRKDTPQCNKLFTDISNTAPDSSLTQEKRQQLLKHFQHVFLPRLHPSPQFGRLRPNVRREKVVKSPLFDFGILGSENAPKVNVIDLKTTTRRPAAGVLLPVYMRTPVFRNNFMFTPYKSTPLLRNGPLRARPEISPAVPHMFNGPVKGFSTLAPKSTDGIVSSTIVGVPTKASERDENMFDDSALERAARM